jgi:hypothetical protein
MTRIAARYVRLQTVQIIIHLLSRLGWMNNHMIVRVPSNQMKNDLRIVGTNRAVLASLALDMSLYPTPGQGIFGTEHSRQDHPMEAAHWIDTPAAIYNDRAVWFILQ